MTANQLKYWELRWKQHYERLYIEETKRSNIARESETYRHNLVSEKISKQELVLRRIDLSIKQEEVNVAWAKLQETQKANIMSWMFQTQELDQKERKLKAEIDKILADKAVAIAEFKATAQHNMNQDFAKFVDSNAKALKNGWGKGAAAFGLASLESIPGIANYNKILDDLNTELGITQSTKLAIVKNVGDANANVNTRSYGDEFNTIQGERDARLLEKFGPDSKAIAGFKDKYGNKVANPSSAGYVRGFTSTQSTTPDGTKLENSRDSVGKPTTSQTPSGTQVIYSPGTKVGPGY